MSLPPAAPTGTGTPLSSLSERERAVLARLAEGHTNKEIARELGLSKNVVDKILSNSSPYSLYPKLGVENAKGAVAWYLQQVEPANQAEAQPEEGLAAIQAQPGGLSTDVQAQPVFAAGPVEPAAPPGDPGRQGSPLFRAVLITVYVALAGLIVVAVRAPARSEPAAAGQIQIVGAAGQRVRVEANGHVLPAGEALPVPARAAITFRVLNNGMAPVTLGALSIGVRGPGVTCRDANQVKWSAPEVPFPAVTGLTLQAGETYEYRAERAIYLPGAYFVEPVQQGMDGKWGGIAPFSCVDLIVSAP